jgi:hypothetical protein
MKLLINIQYFLAYQKKQFVNFICNISKHSTSPLHKNFSFIEHLLFKLILFKNEGITSLCIRLLNILKNNLAYLSNTLAKHIILPKSL